MQRIANTSNNFRFSTCESCKMNYCSAHIPPVLGGMAAVRPRSFQEEDLILPNNNNPYIAAAAQQLELVKMGAQDARQTCYTLFHKHQRAPFFNCGQSLLCLTAVCLLWRTLPCAKARQRSRVKGGSWFALSSRPRRRIRDIIQEPTISTSRHGTLGHDFRWPNTNTMTTPVYVLKPIASGYK